jgi:PEP-CTERM motif
MTFVKQVAGAAVLGAGMLIGCGLLAPPAHAGYTVTLDEVGGNVVATGSGTIDLTGLSLAIRDLALEPLTTPIDANIVVGSPLGPQADIYTGVTGPASFGTGSATTATSGSGDIVGINGFLFAPPPEQMMNVDVPTGYMSGEPLSDMSTYDNATFASLGVTPGTYVWTWGSGPTDDTFTLQIGPAAVPEPSSLALLGLAFAGLPLVRRRRCGRYQ